MKRKMLHLHIVTKQMQMIIINLVSLNIFPNLFIYLFIYFKSCNKYFQGYNGIGEILTVMEYHN